MDTARLNHPQYVVLDPELAAYSGAEVNIVRCVDCGFGQPKGLPALPRYFDRMYALQHSVEWMETEFERPNKDLIFATIIEELSRRVAPGERSLLDIGTHLGRFIHRAGLHGFAAEGVELNARASAFAARATGRPVHQMSVRELIAKERRYDAVTLIDVLEHIPEPMVTLDAIRGVLKVGGWMAVKVPHGRAQWMKEHLRARLQPGYRPCIADNLLHVNQFGVRSLRLALERAGFSDVSIQVAAPELATREVARRKIVNALRLGVWHVARRVPGAVRSPLGLHLQAYARAT